MPAADEYFVVLDTDKPIGEESFAREFLAAWLSHPTHELRPERWGKGEPTRSPIELGSLEQLVREWCSVALMFKRVSRPRMTVSINWRKERGRDPRPFPWGLQAWLAKNAGDDVASDFFRFVVEHFNPAFAALTTFGESRRKHLAKVPVIVSGKQVATGDAFVGHHVGDRLPGIYWMTYFGLPAIELVSEKRLRSIPIGHLEPLGEGLLLTAYTASASIGTVDSISVEAQLMRHLGEQQFFAKSSHQSVATMSPRTH